MIRDLCHEKVNAFLTNVSILYPLKTTEQQRCSGVLRGYKMGTVARNGSILLRKFVIPTIILKISFFRSFQTSHYNGSFSIVKFSFFFIQKKSNKRLFTKSCWLFFKQISVSSHLVWSIKKFVLENFAKITGKHLRRSLSLNKVGLRPEGCDFIKK